MQKHVGSHFSLTFLNPVRSLALNPGVHGYWQEWKQKSMRLTLQPKKVSTALILTVSVSIPGVAEVQEKRVKALVDTGAAIPLVFRTGLFPSSVLQASVWPVKFVTASGSVMFGGTSWSRMIISFPVKESGIDQHVKVVCDAVWAYEASLSNADLIIGYPFLAGFSLCADRVWTP